MIDSTNLLNCVLGAGERKLRELYRRYGARLPGLQRKAAERADDETELADNISEALYGGDATRESYQGPLRSQTKIALVAGVVGAGASIYFGQTWHVVSWWLRWMLIGGLPASIVAADVGHTGAILGDTDGLRAKERDDAKKEGLPKALEDAKKTARWAKVALAATALLFAAVRSYGKLPAVCEWLAFALFEASLAYVFSGHWRQRMIHLQVARHYAAADRAQDDADNYIAVMDIFVDKLGLDAWPSSNDVDPRRPPTTSEREPEVSETIQDDEEGDEEDMGKAPVAVKQPPGAGRRKTAPTTKPRKKAAPKPRVKEDPDEELAPAGEERLPRMPAPRRPNLDRDGDMPRGRAFIPRGLGPRGTGAFIATVGLGALLAASSSQARPITVAFMVDTTRSVGKVELRSDLADVAPEFTRGLSSLTTAVRFELFVWGGDPESSRAPSHAPWMLDSLALDSCTSSFEVRCEELRREAFAKFAKLRAPVLAEISRAIAHAADPAPGTRAPGKHERSCIPGLLIDGELADRAGILTDASTEGCDQRLRSGPHPERVLVAVVGRPADGVALQDSLEARIGRLHQLHFHAIDARSCSAFDWSHFFGGGGK